MCQLWVSGFARAIYAVDLARPLFPASLASSRGIVLANRVKQRLDGCLHVNPTTGALLSITSGTVNNNLKVWRSLR
jgi:hypothetical protein